MTFFERDWNGLTDTDILKECGCTEREREMYESLRASLKPTRLRHSLGVMVLAMALAEPYGTETVNKARLAGLLHDCAKSEAGALEHGPAGAEKAAGCHAVSDPEVLSAIRWHTTGHADMTVLEMILYVADYAEPFRRPLPGLPEIRRIAFRDLKAAVGMCARATLHYLKTQGIQADPHTEIVAMQYGNMERKHEHEF